MCVYVHTIWKCYEDYSTAPDTHHINRVGLHMKLFTLTVLYCSYTAPRPIYLTLGA